MGCKKSRAVVVGLGAAAAALGSAAIMAAATAPTARADLTADIDAEIAAASAQYDQAVTDFAGPDTNWAAGLNALFESQDNYLFGVPDIYQLEETDALLNQPVTGISNLDFTWMLPANQTAAITEAQNFSNLGNTDMTISATDFSNGDWTDGTLYNDLGNMYFGVIDWQVLAVGDLEAFIASLPTT